MVISTEAGNDLALLRLMQLISPSLPIGGYSYSQGLEWAVEAGWVTDGETLADWLEGLLSGSLATVDIPILARLYPAIRRGDRETASQWSDRLLACRESAELRAEERDRGQALARLLGQLGLLRNHREKALAASSQAAGFTLAAVAWDIPPGNTLLGYTWSWLENQVLAAVKLIPLGQTTGQQTLHRLSALVPSIVFEGAELQDNDIGGSAPALAIASSLHETQYTRLFRS
jgi:urease accessory protein